MAFWTLFNLSFAIDNFTVVENGQGRAALVEIWVFGLCVVNLMACLFITPNLHFLLIGYGPSLLLADIYIIASYGHLESYANLAVSAIIFAVFNLMVTYALQRRELIRFLDLKQSEQKSEQLLAILNGQQNSILVVKSNEEHKEAQNETDCCSDILFCNDRCVELFELKSVNNANHAVDEKPLCQLRRP